MEKRKHHRKSKQFKDQLFTLKIKVLLIKEVMKLNK